MKYKILFITLALSYFFFFPKRVQAEVVINEFAVDSSQQVEILNTGTSEADISNWYIDDNGGTTYFTIPENTVLISNSCIVFNGEFNLNKSSADAIRLFDRTGAPTSANAHLIDTFSYSKGPGVNSSYARLPDGGQWGSASSNFGNFNSNGMSCVVLPTPTATSTPTPTSVPTATITPSPSDNPQTPLSYDNIYINEALVYPESGNFEQIEFFNNNDFSVTLTNWFIDDSENAGSTPRQFSLTIPAKGYMTYELITGIFNNDADQVRLLDFNKQTKDSFEYSSSTKGKSWGRVTIDTDTFCLQESSFSSQNNTCITITPTSVPTTSISKATKITVIPTPSPIKLTTPIKNEFKSKPTDKASSLAPGTNPNENSTADIYNQTIPDEEVLGEETGSKNNVQKKAFINMTLFTSSSYSILAFITLLMRVKTSL